MPNIFKALLATAAATLAMESPKLLRGLLAGLFVVATGGAQAALYNVTDIGFLPGGSSYAVGQALNNAGTVVGYGDSSAGQRSFVWTNGAMVDFATLPNGVVGGGGTIQGLGNTGAIVGAGDFGAYAWVGGVRTDLGYFPSPLASSVATAINDNGVVTGWGYAGPGSYHGWTWQNGVFTDIGTLGGPQSSPTAINNNGVVVGGAQTNPFTQHAFSWAAGEMTDLGILGPLSDHSFALDVNDSNAVVGGYSFNGGNGQGALLWKNQTVVLLPTFASASSLYYAQGINNAGMVVGNALNAANSQRAVRWVNGEIEDLNGLVQPLDGGAVLKAGIAINESGQILALGDNMHSYLLTPVAAVPEPSIAALLGLGVFVLVGYSRRKQ